jgi:neutral ceramidase
MGKTIAVHCREAPMPERELLAGAATAVLMPNLGVSVCGSMQDRRAEHLHDDLTARALVLDNGSAKIALVVLDLFAAKKDWLGEIKHQISGFTKIPMANIAISCTHTHSAVATVDMFQTNADANYMKWAAPRVADCVRTAVQRLTPVRIGWAVGREERVVFNRRYFMVPAVKSVNPFGELDRVRMNPGEGNKAVVRPAGPIDPEVAVLAVQKKSNPDGQPLAVYASYSLNYVGRNPGTDISADYFGVVAGMLHDKLNAPRLDPRQPFVAMLANGCSGDINNIDVRRHLEQPYPYHQIFSVAEIVASAVDAAYRRVQFHDWVPLAVADRMLELGVRRPSAQEVSTARELLQRAPQGPLRAVEEIYARETVLLAQWPATIRTPVQAIRIGEMAIALLPGMPFCQIGLNIKAKSPFKMTMMVGAANDHVGYVPTEEAHSLGGYETWRAKSSFLEVKAANAIQEVALGVLGTLAN